MSKTVAIVMSVAAIALVGCGQKPDQSAVSSGTEASVVQSDGGKGAQMTPGLWEMSTQVMGMTVNGIKVCVDEVMAKDGRWDKTEMDPKDCEKFDHKRRSGGGDIDMVCTREGQTVSAKISYEVPNGTTFRQTMDMTMTNGPQMQTVTEGKWISECPADMKPGDMLSDAAKLSGIPR